MTPRRITVLGATGSVGCNTLDLIARAPDDYEVVALTGGRNTELLAQQARTHRARIAVTAYEDCLGDLRQRLTGTGIDCGAGTAAIAEVAARPADWVMSAIVGHAGLAPGLAALEQGATLALANKESLVTAGALMLTTAKDRGATILPVDSEHSAIFQALSGEDIAAVERIVITASGGAFRDWPLERMAQATSADASRHPNWAMGQRITIDSASMFNKALELIETHEFFGVPPDRIEALFHPESMIHAIVGFVDGGMMAHIGSPDMRHSIGYALHWPARRALPVARLDFAALGQFTFRAPDEVRYPALRLAREVMCAGGLTGAVFNGAKEHVLDAFIEGRIGFLDMAEIVGDVLGHMAADSLIAAPMTLDNVAATDHLARIRTGEAIAGRQRKGQA